MTLSRSPLKRKAPLGQRGPILKSTPKPKLRKCAVKGCDNRFQARNMGHRACGPECAALLVVADRIRREAKQAKQERAEIREHKEKLKTLSDWIKDVQRVFNAYVRERDRDQPCICCGRDKTAASGLYSHGWDCGHYRSTGSAPHLRFHEDNAHRQLVYCNRDRSGNAVEYRAGLIARIGLARVEALEADNSPRHYTIEDLKQIKATYKAKLKALKETP
jgi:hypothetical protein